MSGGVRGDFRITVRASPRGVPDPSSALQPVGLPLERAGTSAEQGTPPVSFYAPPDDQMSIAALSPGMMARVESSTVSRSFESGRVISWWGPRWFSAPPSSTIFPGSA